MSSPGLIFARVRQIVRLRPHDTSTLDGRSHERYRRMILSSVAALCARAVGLLTSLVSVPLTFHYLGAERYGLWMVLISFISAMGFADLGIGNGLMNAVAEAYGKDDHDLARRYVTSALALMLGIAVVLVLAGSAAYPFIPWARVFNVRSAAVAAEGAAAFLVLFGWFVVNIPLGVITRAQAGLQRDYWSQTISACGNIISLLGLIVVIVFHGSLAWLVFASTFGTVLATLANGWVLFRACPWLLPRWRAFQAHAAIRILKMGLLFFVLQCAGAVAFTSDNIVIARVLGVAAVAVYAVPQKLFTFVSMLFSMGLTPIWPAYTEAAARNDAAWVRRAFRNMLGVTLGISVPVCLLFAVTGPWIVHAVVSKSLPVPVHLYWALAAWTVIATTTAAMSIVLNGLGILKAQAFIGVVGSTVNLALSIFLTMRLGVVGVCLGSIIAQVLIVFPFDAFVIRRAFRQMTPTWLDPEQAPALQQQASIEI